MTAKTKYIFIASLIAFTLFEIYLVKYKQFTLGIYMYMIYVLALFMIDKRLVISLFVYYLPLQPIITTDYKLFSMLGPHEIVYGFSMMFLLFTSDNSKIRLNKSQKIAISFVYLLFFINIFKIFKNIQMGLDPDQTHGGVYIFKNLVRYFLYYYSLILLIRIIYDKGVFDYVFIGIKWSVVTIPISMLFTKVLILLGAGITFAPERREFLLSGEYQRFVGFYSAGGDENSVGIFLVAAFGFFLALFEKTGDLKRYIVYMGFAVLGILLSGSRTSLLALVIVIVAFLITNKSNASKFYLLIACIIFYFLFFERLNMVIERFFDPSAKKAIDSDEMGRVGKWIFYSDWILNNPKTLLYGNQKRINYDRSPHNYFIWIIYHVGIIPFILFCKYLLQLSKYITVSEKLNRLKSFYYIVPFFFILMTVNSFGSSIYLWLYLPLGAFYRESNLTSKKVKELSIERSKS